VLNIRIDWMDTVALKNTAECCQQMCKNIGQLGTHCEIYGSRGYMPGGTSNCH